MKLFAVILAILFFNLSVFPCSEEENEADQDRGMVVEADDADEMDLCSPFCFCQCCHIQSEYLTYFTVKFIHPYSVKMPETDVFDIVGFIPSSWHPPQV